MAAGWWLQDLLEAPLAQNTWQELTEHGTEGLVVIAEK